MRALPVSLILVAAAGATATAVGAHRGSFPCSWRWDLRAGLREGYVTAGASADCGGRSGSLTISARLLRWNPKTKRWHVDRAHTTTWRNLGGSRYVELAERCVGGTVRAVFRWTLRDSGGRIVATNAVTTGRLRDPGPGCKITLG